MIWGTVAEKGSRTMARARDFCAEFGDEEVCLSDVFHMAMSEGVTSTDLIEMLREQQTELDEASVAVGERE